MLEREVIEDDVIVKGRRKPISLVSSFPSFKRQDEMKTALIHMVSHELRTPFAVIQSSAEILEMMQQQRQAPDAGIISSHASNILQEISHVTEILNRMVMFSRIESGVLPGSAEAIDVESFVSKILTSGFAPWKDGRKVGLKVTGIPKMARIDHVMLGLVLRNLLDNACKYSPHKRPPVVRLRFLQSRWSLSVRDFGIGIPAEDQARLFKPFSRASNVGNKPGLGLGLMIVDYIVKNYRGSLLMKSREGFGTTFTVSFSY
jgi:signal transduction histidine kinase